VEQRANSHGISDDIRRFTHELGQGNDGRFDCPETIVRGEERYFFQYFHVVRETQLQLTDQCNDEVDAPASETDLFIDTKKFFVPSCCHLPLKLVTQMGPRVQMILDVSLQQIFPAPRNDNPLCQSLDQKRQGVERLQRIAVICLKNLVHLRKKKDHYHGELFSFANIKPKVLAFK